MKYPHWHLTVYTKDGNVEREHALTSIIVPGITYDAVKITMLKAKARRVYYWCVDEKDCLFPEGEASSPKV